MKRIVTALTLATALALPTIADAGTVTLTTQLKRYNGAGAYLAYYLVGPDGRYEKTLWVSGGKSKYYKHLRDWSRAGGNTRAEIQGATGASTGSGKTRVLSVEISDALIDAGYDLRIDAAVENRRESPSEVIVPLTRANAGKPLSGRSFIKSFQFSM